MKILIADDEPVARQVLRELLEECAGVEVAGEATDGQTALDQVVTLEPDVVLLDLQMPGLDGFAVARRLRGRSRPLIVYVTAFESHALEAFETGALDYLLKPVRKERLEAALEKARIQLAGLGPTAKPANVEILKAGPPRRIVGRSGPTGGSVETELHLVDPADVVAFQAEGDTVLLHTLRGRYYSDLTLKELVGRLPGPPFRRIHRSTIINTDHIRTIFALSSRRWSLRMSSGLEVVVSKRMAAQVREVAGW